MRPSRQSAGRAATLAALMAILLVGFTLPTGAHAQTQQAQAQTPAEWDAAREEMSRAELEVLLQRLETEAQSTAYSQRLREQARRSADLVRARLTDGDFQVGDRIVLTVQQQPEMSDTLTVRSGRVVTIPVVGDLSLAGVLRAELNDYMHEHVARYVRDPTVRTETLIRSWSRARWGAPGSTWYRLTAS
jgi:hypothetical protein